MAKTKTSGIEAGYVSSPTRTPRYHPFFSTKDSDGQEIRFFTHAFRTAYEAHYWLDTIMTACADSCTQSWKDEYTLVFTHTDTGHTLSIREHHLEDVIEYEPTKEEAQWTPPYPDSAQLDRLTHFWDQRSLASMNTDSEENTTDSSPEPEPSKKPSRAKTPNRHRTQKPAEKGMTTVAILAAEAGIPANKARQMLRKAGIKKPEGGWTFKTNDPTVKTITDLFAKG